MTTHTRHYRGSCLSTLRLRATKPGGGPIDWAGADAVLAPLGFVPCGSARYHLTSAAGRFLAFLRVLGRRVQIERSYGGDRPCPHQKTT